MIVSQKPKNHNIEQLQEFLKQNTVYDLIDNNNNVGN